MRIFSEKLSTRAKVRPELDKAVALGIRVVTHASAVYYTQLAYYSGMVSAVVAALAAVRPRHSPCEDHS
jgi:hypothetical protein